MLEDGLGGELFAAQPQRMARLFHPLLAKSFTSPMLLMQIRGGQIHEIYKGKGSQKQATSYRDVTIASELAKTVGSLLRPHMLSTVAAVSGGTQFGSGLSTGSTDVAHVLVRAYIDAAQVLHVSLGLLFVHLSSAFASVARALAFRTHDPNNREWNAKLLATGFSQDEAGKMMQGAQAYVSGGSAHVQALLCRLHRGTWASTEGLSKI